MSRREVREKWDFFDDPNKLFTLFWWHKIAERPPDQDFFQLNNWVNHDTGMNFATTVPSGFLIAT